MKGIRVVKVLVFMLCYCVSTSAQNLQYKKNPSITLNFFLNDYKTPELINKTSLGTVIKNKQVSSFSEMHPGIAVSFFNGISNKIDFNITAGGSFAKYAIENAPTQPDNKLLIETDGNILIKLVNDKHVVLPYLTTGFGASYFSNRFGLVLPFGTGIQFGVGKGSFISSHLQYKVGLTRHTADHFNISVGFGGLIKHSKKPSQKKIIPPASTPLQNDKDSDGDGITDLKDKCPQVFGLLKYAGCPETDTDKDGIIDDEDACPTVPGVAKYKGCPIPDSDGDGINDEDDNCPFKPGLFRYKGCPIPDTDGDGLNDEKDSCITKAGPLYNKGCPEKYEPAIELIEQVKKAATQIFFETGSSKLLLKSYAPLNEVAKILLENPLLSMNIEGHTDSIGENNSNLILSKRRAEAVATYLQTKGVDAKRLFAKGFGETQPITSNSTVQGRAKNRRVELTIKQKP
jgi:outer membrane protein OmpA-like peptidoglycan-associated protein